MSNILISIHAPLRERPSVIMRLLNLFQFQSTLPCGSDIDMFRTGKYNRISIHAPLRERRANKTDGIAKTNNFNPRSLAGATCTTVLPWSFTIAFQSTLPCGSDFLVFNHFSASWYFNPRSLAGATHDNSKIRFLCCGISIHAPLRERLHINQIILHSSHFNPRSLAGATATGKSTSGRTKFQSTLPCGSDRHR